MKLLRTIQRQALLMLGHFRKGTPTEGLNIITNTTPIELFVESEILKANARLGKKVDRDWDGLTKGQAKGHIHKVCN